MRLSCALLVMALPIVARADRAPGECVDVAVDFTPTDALQIVAWIERSDGTFVDTIYVTNKVGRYGMGNRPGDAEYGTSNPLHDTFPYGRRVQTFPVWAHRHGLSFPMVVAQDGNDKTLSHAFSVSSVEYNPPYCRPYLPGEDTAATYDTGTCASTVYTDKGTFASSGATSLYPPRADVDPKAGIDSPAVAQYRAMNPFDAISKPTPVGGAPASVAWSAPLTLPFGDYVIYVEAAKTFDFNASYGAQPISTDLDYSLYGKPWRGQPSIVYRVPFTLASADTSATSDTYVGYGDVDGASGNLHAPDATITTDTPGSGASRLSLVSDTGSMYRVRVRSHYELDAIPPAAPGNPTVVAVTHSTATIQVTAPGDDGMTGAVTSYEIRIRANAPITADNFAASMTATTTVVPVPAGQTQTIELAGLLPETEYSVGIVPIDNCYNKGDMATASFTTANRDVADVPWCFVATAAYGSVMANDVQLLRRFRDSMLTRTVMGELAVETYYTFGPAMAGMIGESELLRASARAVLEPIVTSVRKLTY